MLHKICCNTQFSYFGVANSTNILISSGPAHKRETLKGTYWAQLASQRRNKNCGRPDKLTVVTFHAAVCAASMRCHLCAFGQAEVVLRTRWLREEATELCCAVDSYDTFRECRSRLGYRR
jgi:hypothetical protein